jgi:hypothetical protein
MRFLPEVEEESDFDHAALTPSASSTSFSACR